jgi:hypothetical protein
MYPADIAAGELTIRFGLAFLPAFGPIAGRLGRLWRCVSIDSRQNGAGPVDFR